MGALSSLASHPYPFPHCLHHPLSVIQAAFLVRFSSGRVGGHRKRTHSLRFVVLGGTHHEHPELLREGSRVLGIP